MNFMRVKIENLLFIWINPSLLKAVNHKVGLFAQGIDYWLTPNEALWMELAFWEEEMKINR
jgi:hypothetical protein